MSDQESYTPADLCERWRCCHSHVLNLIRSGELVALNIGTAGRARYVVTSEALEAFEDRRTVAPEVAPVKRKKLKRSGVIEFFK